MNAHYLLPAGVIVLKFIMKVAVEQEVNRIDFVRATLIFPIDIAFLSLSFGVAIVTFMQLRDQAVMPTEDVLLVFVGYVITTFIVTVLSKKSDKAFIRDNNMSAIGFFFLSCFLSVMVMAISLHVLGVL
jgi:hypothetical protein